MYTEKYKENNIYYQSGAIDIDGVELHHIGVSLIYKSNNCIYVLSNLD